MQTEVVDAPSTVAAQHARGVGVIDEDGRADRLGRLDDGRQGRDVAVHREHAVGDDEDQPIRLAGALATVLDRLVQDRLERLDVGVREDLARRLRQAHAVDDRGVVESVADDQVGLAGDGRDDAGVGREAGLEGEDGWRALELGELGLERLVHRHRPGDRPDGARPDAEFADGSERRLAQPWMVGQARGSRWTRG